MLLIIEGPDCSGKTTLAQTVAAAHPGGTSFLNYGPPDPPDGDPFLEYEAGFIGKLSDNPQVLTVVDRLAAGELVYGPLLRGRSRLTPGGLLHCEMLYESLGAVRVMMMPPLQVIISRMRQRGDDLIDIGDCAYIHEKYAWIAPRYSYRQLRDAAVDDMPALMTTLRVKAMDAATIALVAPGYIGCTKPRLILAGDIRAGNPLTDPYIHAFTPAATRSGSTFLMNSLARHSRQVIRQVGILNTGEPGMNLSGANAVLGNPVWVALGSAAAARLARAEIPCHKIPHPAWIQRFAQQDEEQYGKNIMQYAQPEQVDWSRE